jgi:hypothetical protein
MGTHSVILAKTSWKRVFFYTVFPFIVIGVLALFLSNKSIEQIVSVENWATPTRHRPSPAIAIGFIAAYILMVAYRLFSLLRAKGKYLWVCHGDLMVENKSKMAISEIDPGNIRMSRRVLRGRELVIGTRDGRHRAIRMDMASFDEHKLIAEIKSMATATP